VNFILRFLPAFAVWLATAGAPAEPALLLEEDGTDLLLEDGTPFLLE
jgi:hypothetical protein